MRPVVLVTTDRRAQEGLKPGPKVRPYRPEAWIGEAYVAAVRGAGGLPVLVPPGETDIDALLGLCQAVVITGGAFDIHPSWYGEAVSARIDRIEEARTAMEIALARACLERGVPLLGVCGGMQAMAVAAGGTLIQDIPAEGHLVHEQPTDPATPWHDVRVEAPASQWLGDVVAANSTHHQAVKTPGSLIACGWSADGVVEVIAAREGFALGVQWHPEVLGDLRAYQALVRAAQSS
jgi:putative glutamine amidotransferase